MNVADAIGDDMIVGDDMSVFADDKAAAGNRDRLVGFGRLFRSLVVGSGRDFRRFRLGKIAGRSDSIRVDLRDAIFN